MQSCAGDCQKQPYCLSVCLIAYKPACWAELSRITANSLRSRWQKPTGQPESYRSQIIPRTSWNRICLGECCAAFAFRYRFFLSSKKRKGAEVIFPRCLIVCLRSEVCYGLYQKCFSSIVFRRKKPLNSKVTFIFKNISQRFTTSLL